MYDVEGLRTLEDVERRYGERTVRVRDGAGHGEGEFELDGEGEKRDQYERKRKKARTHGTGEPGDAEGESGEEAAERPKDLMREQEVVLERADKRERVRAVMRRGFPLVDALRLGSELNTRLVPVVLFRSMSNTPTDDKGDADTSRSGCHVLK
jgi:hypothetical protein